MDFTNVEKENIATHCCQQGIVFTKYESCIVTGLKRGKTAKELIDVISLGKHTTVKQQKSIWESIITKSTDQRKDLYESILIKIKNIKVKNQKNMATTLESTDSIKNELKTIKKEYAKLSNELDVVHAKHWKENEAKDEKHRQEHEEKDAQIKDLQLLIAHRDGTIAEKEKVITMLTKMLDNAFTPQSCGAQQQGFYVN